MHEIAPSQSRPAALSLLAIILLSVALNAVPLWWGLPSSPAHTWAFDEISPHADGLTVESRHMGRYPPLHYHILRTLYAPVRMLNNQGVLSLEPREKRTTLQILGRGLSLVLAALTLYLVNRIGRRLLSPTAALLATALLAVTLPFVFYAKTINLESPYLFWFALSLLFLLRLLEDHRLPDYLGLAATAALAICTKDQAYALFLGLPPLIALSLHSHLHSTKPSLRTLGRVLLDRRIVLSTVVSVGLFVLIHNLIFDLDGFLEHLRVMTGPGSEPSRIFEHSVAGHAAMLALAGRHLVFSMGLPAILAAVAGIAIAARESTKHKHLLLLLVPVVSYYLFFIAVILYHRVRFFLPVCLVLALFAALALEKLWCTKKVRRPIAALAIAMVIALPLLRAISLDLSMLNDSRYVVENWLGEKLGDGERVLVVGNHEQRLPRGFGSVPWSWLTTEKLDLLRRRDPRFLVYNPAEVGTEEEIEIERQLLDGSLNYEVVFRYRHKPWLDLIDNRGVSSNLITVNPEIAVLEKVHDWGMSEAEVAEALESLDLSFEPKLWNAVRDSIQSSPFLGQRRRLGQGLAFGVHFDSWTRGTDPAAVVVSNTGDSRLLVRLRLTTAAPNDALPQSVRVLARNREFEITFPTRGHRDLRLPAVAPGKTRMFLVSTDREWNPELKDRRLGVHLQILTSFEAAPD